MVTIDCPWCDEGSALSLAELWAQASSFTCLDCGTTVSLAESPSVATPTEAGDALGLAA